MLSITAFNAIVVYFLIIVIVSIVLFIISILNDQNNFLFSYEHTRIEGMIEDLHAIIFIVSIIVVPIIIILFR